MTLNDTECLIHLKVRLADGKAHFKMNRAFKVFKVILMRNPCPERMGSASGCTWDRPRRSVGVTRPS